MKGEKINNSSPSRLAISSQSVEESRIIDEFVMGKPIIYLESENCGTDEFSIPALYLTSGRSLEGE